MIKKFLIGTAMAAAFFAGVILVTLLPVLAIVYAVTNYGDLVGFGTLFVSMCIICGAAHTVFD